MTNTRTVIADATPLHYLVLIDKIEVLHILYDTILIPHAVVEELSAPQTPNEVTKWTGELPHWQRSYLPPLQATPRSFLFLGLANAKH